MDEDLATKQWPGRAHANRGSSTPARSTAEHTREPLLRTPARHQCDHIRAVQWRRRLDRAAWRASIGPKDHERRRLERYADVQVRHDWPANRCRLPLLVHVAGQALRRCHARQQQHHSQGAAQSADLLARVHRGVLRHVWRDESNQLVGRVRQHCRQGKEDLSGRVASVAARVCGQFLLRAAALSHPLRQSGQLGLRRLQLVHRARQGTTQCSAQCPTTPSDRVSVRQARQHCKIGNLYNENDER